MRKVRASTVNGFTTPDSNIFPVQAPTVLHREPWFDAPYYFEYPGDGAVSTRHFGLTAGLNSLISVWVYPEVLSRLSGIMSVHTWRALEPVRGQYDFSRILANLNWMQANRPNARLIVRLLSQSFQKTSTDFLADTARNLPDWFDGDAGVRYYRTANGSTQKGWAECIWHQPTVDRLKLLIQAAGAEFGNHPSLEGIMLMESAGSINTATFPPFVPYTHEAKLDALKQHATQIKESFPGKAVIAAINYLEPTVGASQQPALDWADWCALNGLEVCWEDTCPYVPNYYWPMNAVSSANGRAPLNAIVANTNYASVNATDQLAAINRIYQFGIKAGATRMFWCVNNDSTWANLKKVI